jgi:Ion channel
VKRHRPAFITIAAAASLDLLGAWLFSVTEHISFSLGCYWAVITATTIGFGDVVPHTTPGHWIAIMVALTVVPLFAATFSLFTAGLGAIHLGHAETRLADHMATTREHLHEALTEVTSTLHARVGELQSEFGNGVLSAFQAHVEELAASLHARLDTLETQPATVEDPADGCER